MTLNLAVLLGRGDPEFCHSKDIYTKGIILLVFSEKTGSGGQRELYLTGLGKLAVWMLSQGQGFVYGSMKNSPLSVT